jgi:hypothetical protein
LRAKIILATAEVQPLHALRRWMGITGFSAAAGWPENAG